MAIIRGLWELDDSLMTWEGLPIGYAKEVNINGRVWKGGSWQPFVKLKVTELSEHSGWKNLLTFITNDDEFIDIIDSGFQWWTGFKVDRIVDFGDEFQEIDDVVYNFITTNATQVEFYDIFTILNGNFKWKSVLADGSYLNGISLDIKGTMMQPKDGVYDGFVFMIPDEDTANEFGLTPGVWGLAKLTVNMDTGEQFLQTYQNGAWSSEEARSFTLKNKTLSKSLATYILNNTEPRVSKGPNYTALKNALDRLATAIKNNIGGEAVYPFTIEEMCSIADGTMPAANKGEKGKEGFFYYMEKMAYYIAQRCGVEPPLTIEEMIEALGETSYVNITLTATNGGLNGQTWVAVKFGSQPSDESDFDYYAYNGSTLYDSKNDTYYTTADNLKIDVSPVAYIWQKKFDPQAGYSLNGMVSFAGVGYANATKVKLKDGDILFLRSTGLD